MRDANDITARLTDFYGLKQSLQSLRIRFGESSYPWIEEGLKCEHVGRAFGSPLPPRMCSLPWGQGLERRERGGKG